MKTECPVYYYSTCRYTVDLECGKCWDNPSIDTVSTDESVRDEFEEIVNLDLEDGGAWPPEMNHFSHDQHNLIFNNEELEDDNKLLRGMYATNIGPLLWLRAMQLLPPL